MNIERNELLLAKSHSFVIGLALLIFGFVAGLIALFAGGSVNLLIAFGAFANVGLILMCIGAVKSKIIESHNKQIDLLISLNSRD